MPRRPPCCLLSVCLIAAVATPSLAGDRLQLARNGRPAATIVTAAEPTAVAAFAAAELQLHVEKITGARLPIVGDQADVKGPRVLVGASAATERLGLPGKPLAERIGKTTERKTERSPRLACAAGRASL